MIMKARAMIMGAVLSALLAAGLLLSVVGCGGGGGSSSSGSGTVRVMLTDAPAADISEVHVHITSVQAVASGGPVTLVNDAALPDDIELVALARDPLLLGQPLIPSGDYTQVRLIVSSVAGENWIRTAAGDRYDLKVPSGSQTGAKLVTGEFSVPAGGTVVLLLDLDAAASVHQAGASGQWIMRPTIFASVVDTIPGMGALNGTVLDSAGAPPVPPAGSVLGVYVQGPFGPVGVAEVSPVDGAFSIPGLPAGSYDLQLFYAGLDWVPTGPALSFSADAGVIFGASLPVEIVAGTTLTLALVLPPA